MIANAIVILLISTGLFFFFGACVGMLRLPGFYSRMHAAGKGDTLSTILILSGCAVYVGATAHHFDMATILVIIKLFLIIKFIFIGSPTATHAILDAGHESGVEYTEKEH
jgi:multicomponent Na+:H+ antiporter subunit G